MTCGQKHKQNCPTAQTRVTPEEVAGRVCPTTGKDSAQGTAVVTAVPDVVPRDCFRYGNKVYPSVTWIRQELRNSLWHPAVRYPVRAAYIVGSEARGTARPDSDLDIAVVIAPVQGKTALEYSEAYHAKQRRLPEFLGRNVDLQFFYPDDPELAAYARIEIPMDER